jgi:anti-sigma B factor antagonist
MTPLDLRTWTREGVTVVSVRGEIDIASVPGLSACLGALTAPSVVLDLTELRFCDSSGLGVMIRAWKDLNARSGEFVLAAPQRQVARLLSTTGLNTRIPIHPTVPDAISSLASELIAPG